MSAAVRHGTGIVRAKIDDETCPACRAADGTRTTLAWPLLAHCQKVQNETGVCRCRIEAEPTVSGPSQDEIAARMRADVRAAIAAAEGESVAARAMGERPMEDHPAFAPVISDKTKASLRATMLTPERSAAVESLRGLMDGIFRDVDNAVRAGVPLVRLKGYPGGRFTIGKSTFIGDDDPMAAETSDDAHARAVAEVERVVGPQSPEFSDWLKAVGQLAETHRATYDAVQRPIDGNHVAIFPDGRIELGRVLPDEPDPAVIPVPTLSPDERAKLLGGGWKDRPEPPAIVAGRYDLRSPEMKRGPDAPEPAPKKKARP